MQKIDKTNVPEFFTKAKSRIRLQKTSKAWENKSIHQIRAKLRKIMLESEQDSLCAYCEMRITSDRDKSNIDHYVKRALDPTLTLKYSNLLVSCNSNNRCSHHKDKNLKDISFYSKIINPVCDNPEDYFDYLTTGEIYPKNNGDKISFEKAKSTIDIFQLNQKILVERRGNYSHGIKQSVENSKQKLTLELLLEAFPGFKSFQKIILNKHSQLNDKKSN